MINLLWACLISTFEDFLTSNGNYFVFSVNAEI